MAGITIPTILLISAILVAAATYFHHDNTRSSNSSSVTAMAGTHLHFYMHDQYTGTNPTAALIVPGRPPLSSSSNAATTTTGSDNNDNSDDDQPPPQRRFGDIAVMNNALTEGPERGSTRVGTAQGFTVRVSEHGSVNALSMHLVFQAGELAGSSLVVSGRVDTDLSVRESVIVGGTGRFRGARGYAHSRSYDYDLAKGGVVEIDVYLQ